MKKHSYSIIARFYWYVCVHFMNVYCCYFLPTVLNQLASDLCYFLLDLGTGIFACINNYESILNEICLRT
jgi:hypothetical protein